MHEFRLAIKTSENVSLDQCAVESLQILMGRLVAGEPRRVPCCDQRRPILIFTVGASESSGHTIGGVLAIDKHFEYFSCEVPKRLVEEWGSNFSHFIGLVELYAILVGRLLWNDYLNESRAIYFIDNNSSMDACIRGKSWRRACHDLMLKLGAVRRQAMCPCPGFLSLIC